MDRYSDEELEEAGYFCPKCHLNPCSCEFLEAAEKYGDIICDPKANKLVNDLYDLNKGIDELIKKYKEEFKITVEAIREANYHYLDGRRLAIKEIIQDLEKLKGE